MPAQPGNGGDDAALAALASVKLDSFKAEPSTIAPFYSSRLTWGVTVPDPAEVVVLLDGSVVSHAGEMWVAPSAAQSYQLSAKARNHSRILRTVTVHVDFEQCAKLDTALLPEFLVPFIEDRINADTSGVYLRPQLTLGHVTVPSVRVWISPGRLNVSLRLGKRVAWFPDPTIEISASFGLEVVRETGYVYAGGPAADIRALLTTRLAPAAEDISADVSFPWYAWAAPGAFPGLAIAISHGEEQARTSTSQMVASIVYSLDHFFLAPPHTQKEDAELYINPSGQGIFAMTFCPPPEPQINVASRG